MVNLTDNSSESLVTGDITQEEETGIMSYRTREIYQIVNFVILSSLIGLFGIFSNIINIIIYFKHRFHESMNVSLLGLSISDLCGVLTMEWFNMCTNPLILDTGIPIHTMGFQYATGGWPHVTFTRITCIITVFIAIERCLCITAPLKVKTIITPKRALLVVIGIYVVMILSLCPAYFSFHIAWEFVEEENRTLYTLLVSNEQMERITIAGNFVMQVICFVGIAGSNFMLVYALQQKTKWRQQKAHGPSGTSGQPAANSQKSSGNSGNSQTKSAESGGGQCRLTVESNGAGSKPGAATGAGQCRLTVESNGAAPKPGTATVRGGAADHAVSRDRKLARMIVLLSGILFLCYIPSTIALLVQLIEPGFSMLGRFSNSFFATWSFVWVLDSINSSVNIFLYYNMSSKYRATFNTLFSKYVRKGRVKPEETNADHSAHSNLPDRTIKSTEGDRNNGMIASITSPKTQNSSVASET